MSLQFQIEFGPRHLAVLATGAGKVDEIWPQFELIAEQCRRANLDKLLLDFTQVQSSISTLDRYSLGYYSHIFARSRIKLAVVILPEQADTAKFGEQVAKGRGVNVRVFTDRPAAEKWLDEG